MASASDGSEALVVAPLRNVAHDPLADPELFWSDQVVGEGSARTVSDSASLGVHGLEANRVMIDDRSGSVLAVAIETRRAASTSWRSAGPTRRRRDRPVPAA